MSKIMSTVELSTFKDLKAGVVTWLHSENTLFSLVGEMPVTNMQMLLIVHSVIAFFILIACCNYGVVAALIGLAWFAMSILTCKAGGIR